MDVRVKSFAATSDDEDNALWMASVGVRQDRAIIMYPIIFFVMATLICAFLN